MNITAMNALQRSLRLRISVCILFNVLSGKVSILQNENSHIK